jgi:hypothetical protein
MHAAISAQRLSHCLCDHHHTALPELNARPATTNQHGSRHTGGEEALQTTDKKRPLTNTNNINYKYLEENNHNTYTHL